MRHLLETNKLLVTRTYVRLRNEYFVDGPVSVYGSWIPARLSFLELSPVSFLVVYSTRTSIPQGKQCEKRGRTNLKSTRAPKTYVLLRAADHQYEYLYVAS